MDLIREVNAGDACPTLGLRRQMDDKEVLLAVTPVLKEVCSPGESISLQEKQMSLCNDQIDDRA